MATTAEHGKAYQLAHHRLDVIISVGYRVKSQKGMRFRLWLLNAEFFKRCSVARYDKHFHVDFKVLLAPLF
ncbi:RhuM family protein [Planctobacterium marinum]|uniref:RhuM family protein n=1 Tax=Planctobacterium marinum TaxID=1631968 RepID=UPI00361E0313